VINSALGLALVDTIDMEPITSRPERPGVPNYECASDFSELSREALEPEKAVALGKMSGVEPVALLNLAFERIPLAHLIAESGGPSLPLAVSLEQPDHDRALRRAEIWWGDLLFAREEAEVVARILRYAGVEVSMIEAAAADAQSFRRSYTDPGVDLLWIASHADFDHWQPDDTAMVLASNLRIGLEELAGLPKPTGGRRLLVLNSCDSATMAGLGGPSTVGLAGVVAGRTQAVVAHLWPVRWQSAAAFGALLGVGLVNSGSFRDAFRFATRALSSDDWALALTQIGEYEFVKHVYSGVIERTFLDRASAVLVQ
jgi:hypothetical protein